MYPIEAVGLISPSLFAKLLATRVIMLFAELLKPTYPAEIRAEVEYIPEATLGVELVETLVSEAW